MYGPNLNWWWSSTATHRCPHGRLDTLDTLDTLSTASLRLWEDEEDGEEEHVAWAGDHSTVCHYSAGCHDIIPNDIIPESAEDQRSWGWAGADPACVPLRTPVVNPQGRFDTGQDPPGIWMTGGPQHQPLTSFDGGASPYPIFDSRGQGAESQGCVCVYGQSRAGRWACSTSPGWPGSCHCYELRKRFVVGVEVDIVEEIAFEDTETLEILPDGMFSDDLVELVSDDQLFPT